MYILHQPPPLSLPILSVAEYRYEFSASHSTVDWLVLAVSTANVSKDVAPGLRDVTVGSCEGETGWRSGDRMKCCQEVLLQIPGDAGVVTVLDQFKNYETN
ncbi:hypothetical protein OUZ56_008319 [Daphnia magna]|uniref:Uncharacterized protein n=1 Tax=Daphnia magna TaxID=35525 RepID=A0ABR0ACL4_9CRUS|nr:hypothetical protein OUZ56_008319 [Daphnia magna]